MLRSGRDDKFCYARKSLSEKYLQPAIESRP
jgi:hypothetical protein